MVIDPLFAVLICLMLAYLVSELLKLFKLPRVVGQIGAGLLLSLVALYYVPFTPEAMQTLGFLADLGVILLFYYVGLETNFKAFTKNIKASVLVSVFNTALPFLAGFLLMKFAFHYDLLVSMIVGISLAVSALSVSADILEEMKKLKSKAGQLILSIGAVDDIIELLLLTFLFSLFHLITNITLTRFLLDIGIFILVIVIAKVWFIPYTLKFFERERSSTARFMSSMIIVLLIAILAKFLGFGLLIGAMIAGIITRQTIFKEVTIPDWEEHDIARSTHIVAFGFLIPIFFVSVGLNTQLNLVASNLGLIVLLILVAMLGTVGGTVIATLLRKGTLKEGLIIGWGLNPKGDVELVLATLALKAGVITASLFTALVVMSLFTTIISPIMFRRMLAKHGKTDKN